MGAERAEGEGPMRFLSSPKAIEARLNAISSVAEQKITDIRAASKSREDALRAQVATVNHQLEDFLCGKTPANAVDIKAFKRFIGFEPEEHPAEPVAATPAAAEVATAKPTDSTPATA